jgi:Holliday junction resolvase RusA-like endonuclease
MQTITFTVPGEPQGKGRPRFSKRGGFVNVRTPDKTVQYEKLIADEYRRQCGNARFPDGSELKICVSAYYTIPASQSKKVKAAMKVGELRPTKKPDADNILKVVLDSLNEVAYHDDAQLVDCRVYKFYAELPRLEVTIATMGGETL